MAGQDINANSAAKACLACVRRPLYCPLKQGILILAQRHKHVKCDGQDPCHRCINKQISCIYVASRRGYYARRSTYTPRDVPHHVSSASAVSDIASTMTSVGSQSIRFLGSGSPPSALTDNDLQTPAASQTDAVDMSNSGYGQVVTQSPRPATPRATVLDETINAFYYYSFPAHPFVLPKRYLSQGSTDPEMAVLLPAMRWIGSLFLHLPRAVKEEYYSNACRCISEPTTPRNGYLAQAMLLLVIGLDGTYSRDEAVQLLRQLEELAIEINLHHSSFAAIHGNGLAVVEESWRRTWWELYVVGGMIAGVHRVTNFALYNAETDVRLPCEEDEYLSGVSYRHRPRP